jgi:hypothetical protein
MTALIHAKRYGVVEGVNCERVTVDPTNLIITIKVSDNFAFTLPMPEYRLVGTTY